MDIGTHAVILGRPAASAIPRSDAPARRASTSVGVVEGTGTASDSRHEGHIGSHPLVMCDDGVVPNKADAILQSVARKMADDFENLTSVIEHRPSKGRERERIVTEFLQRYLPPTVRVDQSAEIVTADGDVSGEIDIVISDPNAPQLYDERTFRVVPIESVYGVVEVKSTLHPGDVAAAAEGIRRVKTLKRLAHRPQVGAVVRYTNLYGREWTEHFPTLGHIFAFKSGALIGIAEALSEAEREVPYEHRVDAIYLLDKGLIVRQSPRTLDVAHTPSKKTQVGAIRSDNPLRGMLLQLHALYSGTWNTGVDLTKYFGTNLGEPAGQVVKFKVETDEDGRVTGVTPD
jgi:hypothetical protein